MFEAQHEFISLAREVRRICDTNASWETKYELVFSESVSCRLLRLVPVDWYDPDTTYEEDVLAFCRAVNEKADDIEKALS